MVDGIQGFTANAANFDAILTTTADYDKAIWEQVRAGVPAPQIYSKLIIHDVQIAADCMHDVYQESNGLEGYISLELNPGLMHDAVNTAAEVTHLEAAINRPNSMVEVPATAAGIEAVTQLTKDGVSINITHVFSVAVYEQVAKAYIEGLEIFLDTHSVWRFVPVSVASFSLAPIDEALDPMLGDKGKPHMLGKNGRFPSQTALPKLPTDLQRRPLGKTGQTGRLYLAPEMEPNHPAQSGIPQNTLP